MLAETIRKKSAFGIYRVENSGDFIVEVEDRKSRYHHPIVLVWLSAYCLSLEFFSKVISILFPS